MDITSDGEEADCKGGYEERATTQKGHREFVFHVFFISFQTEALQGGEEPSLDLWYRCRITLVGF